MNRPPLQVEGGRVMDLRKNDARYLGHIERWFNVLLPKMAPYLYHRGGPILMTQVCSASSRSALRQCYTGPKQTLHENFVPCHSSEVSSLLSKLTP